VPKVDFLIIGAQKAGTTSLFEYMRKHPQIHMPAEKEISFFGRNYDRGWDWYMATVSRGAPPGAICGEASIGYMSGTPFADITLNEQGHKPDTQMFNEPLENIIPERIKMSLPDVRLICVLRDPVARAYSHYQMAVLDEAESRTFDDAIDNLLTTDALTNSRIIPTNSNGYIVNGEYHRVLAGFLDVFPREQLMAISSDELSTNATSTLMRIFDFIGVSNDFVPDNLNARYRAAATKRRIPGFDLYDWQRSAAGLRPLRALWHWLPKSLRVKVDRGYRVAGYRVRMWNAHRSNVTQAMSDMPADTRTALIRHFLPDSRALGQLIDQEIPWLRDWREH
jgi:hypothetical protein